MRNYQPLDYTRYSPPKLLAQLAVGVMLVAVCQLVRWLAD